MASSVAQSGRSRSMTPRDGVRAQRPHGQAGLTLIEVMIALSILAIVAMGLASSFLSARAWAELSEDRMTASNAIRAEIERLMALSRRDADGDGDDDGIDALIADVLADGTFPNLPAGQVNPLAIMDGNGTVMVYLDESQVPVELGGSPATFTDANGNVFGPLDLNGDGDTADDLSAGTAWEGVVDFAAVEVRVDWPASADRILSMRRFVKLARVDDTN